MPADVWRGVLVGGLRVFIEGIGDQRWKRGFSGDVVV